MIDDLPINATDVQRYLDVFSLMMHVLDCKIQVTISRQAIEDVVTACSGDFCAALSCLQFSSYLGTPERPINDLA